MKMMFSLLFLISFFMFSVTAGFSQESLTITTYYPSPYGSYHDLTVSHNLRVGVTDEGYAGVGNENYGTQLWFSGAPDMSASADNENTDPVWIARYNSSSDVSELRLNIGDNITSGGQTDAFVVGASDFYDAGAWTPALYVRSDGNVGINTTTPGSNLEVLATAAGHHGRINILSETPPAGGERYASLTFGQADNKNIWFVMDKNYSNVSNSYFSIYRAGAITGQEPFAITYNDQNVGIGTNNPSSKLHVVGDLRVDGNIIADNNSQGKCDWQPYTSGVYTIICPNDRFMAGIKFEPPEFSSGADYHNVPEIIEIYCCDL